MSRRRWVPARLLTVLAVLATGVLTGLSAEAAAPGRCKDPTQIQRGSDGWLTIRTPLVRGQYASLTAYAVDPFRPDHMYVAQNDTVSRSADGGCTWVESLRIPSVPTLELPFNSTTHQLLSVLVTPGRGNRVLALLTSPAGPALVRSDDAGRTWRGVGSGLPVGRRALQLIAAPSNPDVLYLVSTVQVPVLLTQVPVTTISRSSDGGLTWTEPAGTTGPLVEGVDGGAVPKVVDLAVDPLRADDVWAATSAGLFHSRDGARTWAALPAVPGPVGAVTVGHAPGKPAEVDAFSGNEPLLFHSSDGGRRFQSLPTPGGANFASARQGPRGGDLVASVYAGTASVFRFAPELEGWVAIKDAGFPIFDISVDSVPGYSFYGRRYDAILKYPPARVRQEDFVPVGKCVGKLAPFPVPPVRLPEPSRFTPAADRVVLPPGDDTTRRSSLRLPPAPTPLDVFLLVDTTGSMGGAICGLRESLRGVVSAIAQAGIDMHVGLGDYKDYPFISGSALNDISTPETANDYAYKLRRKIGPVDASLLEALQQLYAPRGSGGDDPESILPALFYASGTGEGQDISPPGESPGDIAPGQHAHFRPGSLRVIIDSTDNPYNRSSGYPGPSYDATVAQMRARGVRHIGLAIADRATPDLRALSADTGGVAGVDGADCDGDGIRELVPGVPLVCRVTEDARRVVVMAPAVIAMLEALVDEQPLTLHIESGAEVVRSVVPRSVRQVDVRHLTQVPVDVTYACTVAQAGRTFVVRLTARVGGVVRATRTTTVECGGLAVPPIDVPSPPVAVALPPAVPVPPPLQPPAPNAPNPQARLESVGQANPQAQGQAQSVAVPQRQEQPQTATVLVAQPQQASRQLLMSSRRPSHGPPLAFAALAAMAMAATYQVAQCAALRRRRIE